MNKDYYCCRPQSLPPELASCKTVTLGKETEVYRKDQSLTSETVALRIKNLTSQGNGVNSIEIIDADYIDVEVRTNTELKDHGFTLSINDDTILISSNQDKPFKNLGASERILKRLAIILSLILAALMLYPFIFTI